MCTKRFKIKGSTTIEITLDKEILSIWKRVELRYSYLEVPGYYYLVTE